MLTVWTNCMKHPEKLIEDDWAKNITNIYDVNENGIIMDLAENSDDEDYFSKEK